MDSQERNLAMTDTIDIPIPPGESQQPVEAGDFAQVEEIPKNSEHFSASYRRC